MNRVMNRSQLDNWRYRGWIQELKTLHEFPVVVNGVNFFINEFGSMEFQFKNSEGLIHPDNGYLGPTPDGNDYYPLLSISCSHSTKQQFNPSCSPNLEAVANAIKTTWTAFCKGSKAT